MACRGTGQVISNLGGSPSSVSCPWCAGSGLRAAEIDAQAHWPRNEDPAPAAAAAGDGGAEGAGDSEAG
jgi:hypothetical protein